MLIYTDDCYDYLLNQKGAKEKKVTDGPTLEFDVFEAGKSSNWSLNHVINVKDIFNNSVVINGVRFMCLEDLLKFKKFLNRTKDQHDISVITTYLKTNGKS